MPGSYISDNPTSEHGSFATVDEDTVALGVGLSNPQLLTGSRQMLDLVDKLHNTGVNVDIDLPQIAVIGSQSAGKSSLIESISGITLPRASGTCTRCPTECRLSRKNAKWQCLVFLRYIVDPNSGQPLGQARIVPFGEIIYDKNEVEGRIRRAQQAILNPNRPIQYFLENSDLEGEISDTQLSFSINCVSIQISGPDVADLSFCDLPGLIATSSDAKGAGDVKLITSLAESYIKKESCIILLTVTCETDFENQPAHGLAKKWDPQGQRTIGVLTKPDRIPAGDEAHWLHFIRNERQPLKNNWFCVKQPSSNELKANMAWSHARQAENNFFLSTAPWSDLDSIYQKYLRTENLVVRLSVILSDLISKRIPEIEGELQRSIKAARTALASLPPPPPASPHSEVAALLQRFAADLQLHVEGIPSKKGLLQAIRPEQERFRASIRETAPNFRPFERSYEGVRHISSAPFLIDEEGRQWDGEASDDEEDASEHAARRENYLDESDMDGSGGDTLRNVNTRIYIDEVMEIAEGSLTRELPGHFPYSVQKAIIEKIIQQWKAPALDLCKSIHQFVSEHVKELVKKNFAHFGQGTLEQRVRVIMNKHIQEHMAGAQAKIAWLLALEAQPFSLNTHYFTDYRSKFIAYYRGQRQRYARPELSPAVEAFTNNRHAESNAGGTGLMTSASEAVRRLMAAFAELSIDVTPAQLQKILAEDTMEPALCIMADVRAYFQVAYKRFADTVPLAIDHELVRGVGMSGEVIATLYAHLGMNDAMGHRICRDLAQESPQVADKRADLEKKLERLESAHSELLCLGA